MCSTRARDHGRLSTYAALPRVRAWRRGAAQCRAGASGDGAGALHAHTWQCFWTGVHIWTPHKRRTQPPSVGPAGAALCRRAHLAGKDLAIPSAPSALKHVDPAPVRPLGRHGAELAGAVLDVFVLEPGAPDAGAPLVDHAVVQPVDTGHAKLWQPLQDDALSYAVAPAPSGCPAAQTQGPVLLSSGSCLFFCMFVERYSKYETVIDCCCTDWQRTTPAPLRRCRSTRMSFSGSRFSQPPQQHAPSSLRHRCVCWAWPTATHAHPCCRQTPRATLTPRSVHRVAWHSVVCWQCCPF